MSPYKRMRAQIWPCHKKVKGQPTTIIWINLVDLSPLCYIPRFSLYAFLVLEKKILCVFTVYRHGGHLVQWRGTNCQYPFDRRPHRKSGENYSRGFREEEIKEKKKSTQFYTMYIAKGQEQITPGDNILIVTNKLYYLNHTMQISANSL